MKLLYHEFARRLMALDARNVFAPATKAHLAQCVPSFYQFYDPVDVEFVFRATIVRFVPTDELEQRKQEYPHIQADCIFATCNGEPIYCRNSKVLTCVTGRSKVIEEELAPSFDAFLTAALTENEPKK